jgi:hypothetical protein
MSSRRSQSLEPRQLVLPADCEIISSTFLLFQFQKRYVILQRNVSLYCWGRERSGAIEFVLQRLSLSDSVIRINSKTLDREQWKYLKQIFVLVHQLFDSTATQEVASKVHWMNSIPADVVYEM